MEGRRSRGAKFGGSLTLPPERLHIVHVDEWWIHERLNIRLNHSKTIGEIWES